MSKETRFVIVQRPKAPPPPEPHYTNLAKGLERLAWIRANAPAGEEFDLVEVTLDTESMESVTRTVEARTIPESK